MQPVPSPEDERNELTVPENDTLPVPEEAAATPVPLAGLDLDEVKSTLAKLEAFFREVMVLDQDYGKIPGTNSFALKKPGAEKLCEFWNVTQRPRVVDKQERWEEPFFFYREYEVDLVSRATGKILGTGIGSCNSMESRYRWRHGERTCPACGVGAIIKSKYGTPGWYCFPKKNGCGERFEPEDPAITDQEIGRVENDDIPALHNTVIKMAKKRALVDGIVSITRSAGLLVEPPDDDDDGDGDGDGNQQQGAQPRQQRTQPRAAAQPKAAAAGGAETTPEERQALAKAFAANGHKWPQVCAYVEATHGYNPSKTPLLKKHYAAVLERVGNPEPLA